MKSYTAFTTIKGKKRAYNLSEVMETIVPLPVGIGVFEIEDGSNTWEIAGYYIDEPDEIALSLLSVAHRASSFIFSDVPEQDWVAHVQRDLHPIIAGRFFVYGKHDLSKVPQGSIDLLIEASMAFGTGHHGTTRGCLLAINKLIIDGYSPENIIDIGCGTGVLAMAASKTWNSYIIATDVDPTAIEVAQKNLVANELQNNIECINADGLNHTILRDRAPFDLILANILKNPLIEMAEDFCKSCTVEGIIILSGILNEQYNEVLKVYVEKNFKVINNISLEGWTTLTLRKSL